MKHFDHCQRNEILSNLTKILIDVNYVEDVKTGVNVLGEDGNDKQSIIM